VELTAKKIQQDDLPLSAYILQKYCRMVWVGRDC